MSKSLLILDAVFSTLTGGKYIFTFPRGIEVKKWKLKKFFTTNIEMSKVYLHIPELMDKTVSCTIRGDGMPSDIVALVSDGKANDDNDRNTLFLNVPTTFHKLTVYFTNGENNTPIQYADFSVVLDVIRDN